MPIHHFFLIFYLLPICTFAHSWAEETLAQMSLEEKVGQLFIAPACPLRGEDHFDDWVQLMKQYHIGGAIMKQSSPESHIRLVNRLQQTSDHPLLITADAEWGLSMRMSETVAFPKNKTLGQLHDLELIHAIGVEIGKQCRRVGVHLNFAPVADVNTNPHNPVIGVRSFGDDPAWVSQCVVQMVKGLQEGGVMACAKHFPGHGDTAMDSHHDLPIILHRQKRLETVELAPFRAAISSGVRAIMSAHILVPSLDERLPATLSPAILTNLLRKEMGFEGLIVTDALNMRALANYYPPETIAYYAYCAGCDLLLYGDHKGPNIDDILRNQIPKAYDCLLESFSSNNLDVSVLDEKVLRILRMKEAMQLHLERQVPLDDVQSVLHSVEAQDLQARAKEKSSP